MSKEFINLEHRWLTVMFALAGTTSRRSAFSGSRAMTNAGRQAATKVRDCLLFAADSAPNVCSVASNGLGIAAGDAEGCMHFLRFENAPEAAP
jgi:hypothetical protein